MWYRKAAGQGHDEAQFTLGLMYDKGQGLPGSSKKTVLWYRKAADQGDADAQCNLGWMYDQVATWTPGVLPGVQN